MSFTPKSHLRELLIAYYCPVVCDGYGDANSWHSTCEQAADAALEELERRMPTRVHLDEREHDHQWVAERRFASPITRWRCTQCSATRDELLDGPTGLDYLRREKRL